MLHYLEIKATSRGFKIISENWPYKILTDTAKETFGYVRDGFSYFHTFCQAKPTCNEIFEGKTSMVKEKKLTT
jgi:hypothetical protein